MKLSLTERTSVVCSCCGNKVETMWSFQQEMVVGHFTDGRQIQGQYIKHSSRFCLGGYSAAQMHKTLDVDEGET
jgi:hypothetical protein